MEAISKFAGCVPGGRSIVFLLPWRSLCAAVLLGLAPLVADDFQGATHMMPFEEDTIGYAKQEDTSSIVSALQRRINAGEIKMEFIDDGKGYLRSLLKELKVPEESQVLVFSKTSFQRHRISPTNPRALFYNEGVYIGYIPGSALLEVTAVDDQLGGVFYTLEQTEVEKPNFVRTDQCLECHASSKTMGVPGHLVRSFEVDEVGLVDLITGTSQVNHRTPLAERWGGWYVTGKHGDQVHRGNLFGKSAFERQKTDPNHLGNLTDLKSFFKTDNYPRPSSDIISLMVLEHQGHMHNFITRMQYETQLMMSAYGHTRYLKHKVEAFLRYMLFIEEAPLIAPLEGHSEFVRTFPARGPRDAQGRSLRDFNLATRVFEYPCSYLIYSPAFEALPQVIKDRIYKRLWEVLTERDTSPEYAALSSGSRKAIYEILRDTKEGLPEYW